MFNSHSMIIDDLDFVGVAVSPAKDHSPLIVDPNGVESRQISFQALKPVAGRYAKICQIRRFMQIQQLSARTASEPIRKRSSCPASLVVEQIFSDSVPKRLNHITILSEVDNFRNGHTSVAWGMRASIRRTYVIGPQRLRFPG